MESEKSKNVTQLSAVSRRHCISLGLALGIVGACTAAMSASHHKAQPHQSPQESSKAAPNTGPILVLGDSLSAEYGLNRGKGWVMLLQSRLQSEKPHRTVINASISGDTTAGGRSRLPALLQQHKPSIVILELGGNDALRGLALQSTQHNLQTMVKAAKEANAQVLLVGMQVPPNYGSAYTQQFAEMFTKIAQAENVPLVPFLLSGIGDAQDADKWFQSDRIHPTAKAQPMMLDNVWPKLKPLLK